MSNMSKKLSQPSQLSQKLSLNEKQKLGLEEWERKKKNGEAKKEALEILKNAQLTIAPEARLNNLINKLIPKYKYSNEELTKDELDEYGESLMDYGIDNDVSVSELVPEKYVGMIINLRRELIKEFDCKAYSEKALVDIIVNAYARNLTYSRKLIRVMNLDHTTPNLNCFSAVLSKEIDRANRHFISALETLRQIKQPELKINVKTNTAFIGQNQQFNHNQNETIEVK